MDNKLLIIAVIVGLLLVGGLIAINTVKADNQKAASTNTYSAYSQQEPTCPYNGYRGGCTATSNCGVPTCGAVNGGTCAYGG